MADFRPPKWYPLLPNTAMDLDSGTKPCRDCQTAIPVGRVTDRCNECINRKVERRMQGE